MKNPISYLQTDARWKNIDYSAPGERTTIGKSGCGPTCMAMVISTLIDSRVTPKQTSEWSLKNGFKAKNQGTYYSYFKALGDHVGLQVEQINNSNIYGDTRNPAHEKALNAIKAGNWVICCMGKGNWTSSGHYILWYGIEGNKVLIRDPNSTKTSRITALLSLLQSQVKYYWIVTVPNSGEEDDMDQAKFNAMADIWADSKKEIQPVKGSKEARDWAEKAKIIQGDTNGNKNYGAFCTREQVVVIAKRIADYLKG